MQITKTKSGRLAYSVFTVTDGETDNYKPYVYFAIIESSEMIANIKRYFYTFSFGFASIHYIDFNPFYKLNIESAYNKRDYLLDDYKFSEKKFSEMVKAAQNDINIMLYEFNKMYGNRFRIVSEIQDAKLY